MRGSKLPNNQSANYAVGLTGGIGSGKTVCSDHFNAIGVPIIDTDVIARQVVEVGTPTLNELSTEFGNKILNPDGSLNRVALRDIAFAADDSKAKLDSITHPAIRRATAKQLAQVSYPYCIVVIPLLTAESPFTRFLDRILIVTADTETKIERVKKRSQLSRDEVLRIMQTQLDDKERLNFADDIIHNDGSIAEAQVAVEQLHQSYTEFALAAEHS